MQAEKQECRFCGEEITPAKAPGHYPEHEASPMPATSGELFLIFLEKQKSADRSKREYHDALVRESPFPVGTRVVRIYAQTPDRSGVVSAVWWDDASNQIYYRLTIPPDKREAPLGECWPFTTDGLCRVDE